MNIVIKHGVHLTPTSVIVLDDCQLGNQKVNYFSKLFGCPSRSQLTHAAKLRGICPILGLEFFLSQPRDCSSAREKL